MQMKKLLMLITIFAIGLIPIMHAAEKSTDGTNNMRVIYHPLVPIKSITNEVKHILIQSLGALTVADLIRKFKEEDGLSNEVEVELFDCNGQLLNPTELVRPSMYNGMSNEEVQRAMQRIISTGTACDDIDSIPTYNHHNVSYYPGYLTAQIKNSGVGELSHKIDKKLRL